MSPAGTSRIPEPLERIGGGKPAAQARRAVRALRKAKRSVSEQTKRQIQARRDVPKGRLIVLVGTIGPSRVRGLVPQVAGRPWESVELRELGAEGAGAERAEVIVAARSLAELRRALPWLDRAGRARRVTFAVAATDRARLLVVPAAVGGQALRDGRIQLSPKGSGPAVVRLRAPESIGVGAAARAVLSGHRTGGRTLQAGGLRLGISEAAALDWAVGDTWARPLAGGDLVLAEDDIAPVDLVVGPEATADGAVGVPRLSVREGALVLPPVDTDCFSPAGFTRRTTGPLGVLTCEGDRIVIREAGKGVKVDVGADAGLGEADLRRLRLMRMVRADSVAGDPFGLARVLSQLACAGVPTSTPALPGPIADALGADLTACLESLDDAVASDARPRESWSVTMRRHALLRFAPRPYWTRTADELGTAPPAVPSVSVLLPTRRPDMLAFALAQIERQDWPEVEAVVVLHGIPADHELVRKAVASFSRPLQLVEVDGGVLFGTALNAGTARCSGRFVTKMDDDDWYGPHQVTDLLLAHEYSGAMMIGCADHFTYLHARDVTTRHTAYPPEAPAIRLAGGTLFLAADDLAAVGGWRPVHRAVDRCLTQGVLAAGGGLYSIHDLGYMMYRGAGLGHSHTWNPRRGDDMWLGRKPSKMPGLVAPAQVYPLDHPALLANPPAPQPAGQPAG